MNVLLCGACGRMGKNVADLAAQSGVTVVCGVDVRPAPMPFPVHANFSEVSERADAVIDFSSPAGLESCLTYCVEHELPVVLAATGYSYGQSLARDQSAADARQKSGGSSGQRL